MKYLLLYENMNMLEEVKYFNIIKVILKYIMYVRKYDGIINEYVPNSHVADVFKDILMSIELESRFTEEYTNISNIMDDITSIGNNDPSLYTKMSNGRFTKTTITDRRMISYMDGYFNLSRLKNGGVIEIHKTYQKLREVKDIVRNTMKLQKIELLPLFTMTHNSKYYKLKTTDL